MKTRPEYACYVENNDFVVDDDDVLGYVYMVDDTEDTIVFDVVNDDGDHTLVTAAPFDILTIVESFEDDFEYPED